MQHALRFATFSMRLVNAKRKTLVVFVIKMTVVINNMIIVPLKIIVLVVFIFVFIFPFLMAAVRAVSVVRPVPLFFLSLCCAVWFVMEQIKIGR